MFSTYRSGKQIERLYRNWEGCKEDDNSEMQVSLFCSLCNMACSVPSRFLSLVNSTKFDKISEVLATKSLALAENWLNYQEKKHRFYTHSHKICLANFQSVVPILRHTALEGTLMTGIPHALSKGSKPMTWA